MVEPTRLKNMLVKLDHLPQVGVKITKIFELPPPRKHLQTGEKCVKYFPESPYMHLTRSKKHSKPGTRLKH